MKDRFSLAAHILRPGAVAMALVLVAAGGCRNQPAPRSDQQITSDIQAKIGGEGALTGQNIDVTVVNGVATLSGTVTDEASRALAGNDSGTVDGVRTVVNNLTVQSGRRAPASGKAPAQPGQSSPPESGKRHRQDRVQDRPQEAQEITPPQPVAETAPPQPPPAAQAPPPPPKPVVKEVTLPAGTVVPIRVTETLDSKTAQANDVFHGSLAGDLGTAGVIAVPHGSCLPVLELVA